MLRCYSSRTWNGKLDNRGCKKMPKIENEGTEVHKCPNCMRERLQRTASGIWQCKACGEKTAGGAFKPDTGAQDRLEKTLSKEVEELEEEIEEIEEAKEKLEE
ncbi:MAG: hypothetical protein SVV03_05050 [Candidatus Nanohaloarchaea archaeon]|nr:hypothetical protein [Candidatus Nanohaloarchaea archaeon]